MDDHEKIEQVSLAFHMRSREADILDMMSMMLDEMQRLDGERREMMKEALQPLKEWREALKKAADKTYVGEFDAAEDALFEAQRAAGSSRIEAFARSFPEFRENIDELRVLTTDLRKGWDLFKRTHL